jgi:predicted amidohydrolase YtcJ
VGSRKTNRIVTAAGTALLCCGWAAGVNAQPADLVVVNGKVVTIDARSSIVQAVAIRDGRIAAVGTDTTIRRLIGPSTRVIDAGRRTVIPGLIDSHVHALGVAAAEATMPFRNLTTIAEIQEWVRAEAQRSPPGTWLWTPRVFPTRVKERRFPTLAELDRASPAHPVVVDGAYALMLNTAALRAAGIGADTPDPPGGAIAHASDGTPTGLLRNVGAMLARFRPGSDARVPLDWLERVHREYNKVGITSVIERQASVDGYHAYEALLREKRLHVRATITIQLPRAGDASEVRRFIQRLPFKQARSTPREPRGRLEPSRETTSSGQARSTGSGQALSTSSGQALSTGSAQAEGNEWLKPGALKIVADGGILAGTSYMRESFGLASRALYGVDDPSYRGFLSLTRDQINAAIGTGHAMGWQMVAHVTGDAGVDAVLDAFEAAQAHVKRSDARHTLIHAYFPNPETARRAARLGVMVDTQTAWLYKDADALAEALGRPRLEHFIGLRTWLDAGVRTAVNTDHMFGLNPNTAMNPFNPFLTMYVAVTRRTEGGQTFGANEAVAREEALRLMTIDAASLSFDEGTRGSIEVGKLGDLTILSDDLLTCIEERIKSIEALVTIVGGREAYRSDKWEVLSAR